MSEFICPKVILMQQVYRMKHAETSWKASSMWTSVLNQKTATILEPEILRL